MMLDVNIKHRCTICGDLHNHLDDSLQCCIDHKSQLSYECSLCSTNYDGLRDEALVCCSGMILGDFKFKGEQAYYCPICKNIEDKDESDHCCMKKKLEQLKEVK